MEVASMSSKGAGAAETEQHKAQDSTRRLEAEVKRLSNSLADLTFTYRPVTLMNAQKERLLQSVRRGFIPALPVASQSGLVARVPYAIQLSSGVCM